MKCENCGKEKPTKKIYLDDIKEYENWCASCRYQYKRDTKIIKESE